MDDLTKNLEKRKKSELIAIITLMLQEKPELQRLLTTSSATKARVNPEIYRQQVQEALSAGDNYRQYKLGEVERRLTAIKDQADAFIALENYAEALAIYEMLINKIIQNFNNYRDEYIAFTVTLQGCIDGLDSCFAGEEENPSMRLRVIRLLFAIFHFYTDSSMDFDEDIPGLLIGNTSSEERQVLMEWLQEALSQAKADGHSNDVLLHYHAFLAALKRAERGK